MSAFHSLRSAMRWAPDRIIFVAFDLLHHDGINLRPAPLLERREKLLELVGPARGVIQYSHHVHGGGADFYAAVDRMGLEGMVSKRPDSVYRSGDTEAWLKTKCYEEVDFEVAGVQLKPGSAPLALMATRDAERRYVGSANIALTKAMRERLWAKVQEGKGTPKGADKPDNEWIKPGLVGCVKALKREDKLRHATLRSARRNYDTAAGIAPVAIELTGERAALKPVRMAIEQVCPPGVLPSEEWLTGLLWPRADL